MATIAVLTPGAAEFKTSSYPALGQTSDGSGARRYLAFDADAIEYAYWTFLAPASVGTTTWTATITYAMASATSGKVEFDVDVEAISDGDTTDTDTAESLDTANASAGTTVPGTAGYIDQIAVTLTNKDSVADGDMVRIRVYRDATDGTNDTATGDARIYAIRIDAV